MIVFGEVCDKGHSHAHVDAGADGDGKHGEEEGASGAGAGVVKVPFIHCLVCLQERKETKG